MKSEFNFYGDHDLLEEFHKFLVSRGIKAEQHAGTLPDRKNYYPDFDPVTGQPRSYRQDKHVFWVTVLSNVADLAKKIIEFLTQKKAGKITLTAGGKSKKITRQDSAGNVEKILEEAKGTSITIEVEL